MLANTGWFSDGIRFIASVPGIAMLFAAGSIAAALVYGLVLMRRARGAAALRNRLHSLLPDVPVLGSIAPIPAAKLTAALGGVVQDQTLATSLAAVHERLQQPSRTPGKVVLVTSATAGEGKSTFALNFAAELAKRARVMLVDADLRHPAVSRRLNLPRYDAGLTELVSCDAPYRSCLALTRMPNLHAIRSGSLPGDPTTLLRNPRLATTVRLSERYYDHIVIDSPAAGTHPDASILAGLVDTVIFVIDSRQRRLGEIVKAVQLLKQVNASIGGFVLNRLTD